MHLPQNLIPGAKVRFVLFDAVGTLIYVQPSVAEVYWKVGNRHGSRLSVEEIGKRFAESFARYQDRGATDEDHERQRWRSIVAEVLHDVSHEHNEPFEELWELFAQPGQWSLFSDVPEVWGELQRRRITVGIASNFDSRLRRICQSLSPLMNATHCFVSSEIGFSKPHPEFYRRVERALGAKPAEILLVGDSLIHDVEGARTAGWQAIHLERHRVNLSAPVDSRSMTSLTELLH